MCVCQIALRLFLIFLFWDIQVSLASTCQPSSSSKKPCPRISWVRARATKPMRERRLELGSGRLSENSAVETIQVSPRQEPTSPQIGVNWTDIPYERLLSYGRNLRKENLHKQSASFFRMLLDKRYHPQIAYEWGISSLSAKKWKDADSAFKMIQHFESDAKWKARSLYGLGTSILGQNKSKMAHYYYVKILSMYSDTQIAAGALFKMGRMEERVANFSKAIGFYRRAGEEFQNRWSMMAMKRLAKVYSRMRESFQAVKAYLSLCAKFPQERGDAYFAIAKIYDRSNNRLHALRYYRRMLHVSPYHLHSSLAQKRIQSLSGKR